MKFEMFKEMVKENIIRKMGNDYEVILNDVLKNNDTILTGLTIRKNDINIAPTIYLDNYYKMYQEGRYTIYTIVNEIINTFEENKMEKSFDAKFFLDFETVQPRIVHKVINKECNKELLKTVPYADFLDLAIIFQVVVTEASFGHGMATITIRHDHCKLWGIGIDELIFAARRNTPKYMVSRANAMQNLLGNLLDLDDDLSIPMDILILTNDKQINGANVILDKNFLRECSDTIGNSYYILPSSIHELLAIPDNGFIDVCDLKEMVRQVNDTTVKDDEILSYSVYYFDRENDRLSVL